MNVPNIEHIREELDRLMREQIDSLARQTFLGVTQEELQHKKERLKRIREISADFLEALKRVAL